MENRNLRENQYQKRRELDVVNSEFKETNMLHSMQEQAVRQVDENVVRSSELQTFKLTKKHKDHTELNASLFDAIFDIADEAYKHL